MSLRVEVRIDRMVLTCWVLSGGPWYSCGVARSLLFQVLMVRVVAGSRLLPFTRIRKAVSGVSLIVIESLKAVLPVLGENRMNRGRVLLTAVSRPIVIAL